MKPTLNRFRKGLKTVEARSQQVLELVFRCGDCLGPKEMSLMLRLTEIHSGLAFPLVKSSSSQHFVSTWKIQAPKGM